MRISNDNSQNNQPRWTDPRTGLPTGWSNRWGVLHYSKCFENWPAGANNSPENHSIDENNQGTAGSTFLHATSSGVILRHLLELAPAAWHTTYARHQQSSARWKSYWHTDGQSGLILKQTIQIYISIYYAFNVHLLPKSWQPNACLNSQNYYPPHGTPSFMAYPTYKLGCDRRYIPMVSMLNSTSCQSTLSSTSPWHTADRIDFFFRSFQVIFLCFWFLPHSFQPLHKSLGSLLKSRALPRTSSTSNNSSSSSSSSSSRPSSRPLQSLSKTSPGWVLIGCNFNEVRTRCERGLNEVRNQILGDLPPKSPDKLFGSHMLSHSSQNSKTQELSAVEQKQKRKPSQAAAAGKSKETEEETKGE